MSRNKLLTWIDTIAVQLNLQNSFIYKNTTWIPGCFHHLTPQNCTDFRNAISRKCMTWQVQAMAGGHTCGCLVQVGGGPDTGKAALYMEMMAIGPFWDSKHYQI